MLSIRQVLLVEFIREAGKNSCVGCLAIGLDNLGHRIISLQGSERLVITVRADRKLRIHCHSHVLGGATRPTHHSLGRPLLLLIYCRLRVNISSELNTLLDARKEFPGPFCYNSVKLSALDSRLS